MKMWKMVEEEGKEDEAEDEADGYRTKNKNPTQWCGEQQGLSGVQCLVHSPHIKSTTLVSYQNV